MRAGLLCTSTDALEVPEAIAPTPWRNIKEAWKRVSLGRLRSRECTQYRRAGGLRSHQRARQLHIRCDRRSKTSSEPPMNESDEPEGHQRGQSGQKGDHDHVESKNDESFFSALKPLQQAELLLIDSV